MSPKPYWILRHHGSSSIRSLCFAPGLLAIGDESGTVSLVDLKTLRPRFTWTAHTDSILTVIVVDTYQVVTHARDNSLKLWRLPTDSSAAFSSSAIIHSSSGGRGETTCLTPEPQLIRTIGVNALNFAKTCLHHSLVAVPNALDAAYIDILDLTTGVRTHEAIGRPDIKPASGSRLPIVMSLHLVSEHELIAGYEDGYVKRWRLDDGEMIWSTRCHSESVMAVSISNHQEFGISVGADDRIARFNLSTGEVRLTQTNKPGNASAVIAPDAQTFVVAAWDGSITVYSASDLSRLGSLEYHRDTVECLVFARVKLSGTDAGMASDDSDDDDDDDDSQPQGSSASTQQLVLAAGGKDGKVSLWKYH